MALQAPGQAVTLPAGRKPLMSRGRSGPRGWTTHFETYRKTSCRPASDLLT